MKNENKFLQGYSACLTCIIEYYGENNAIVKEAYGAGFGNMSTKEMVDSGIQRTDIQLFKKHNLIKA